KVIPPPPLQRLLVTLPLLPWTRTANELLAVTVLSQHSQSPPSSIATPLHVPTEQSQMLEPSSSAKAPAEHSVTEDRSMVERGPTTMALAPPVFFLTSQPFIEHCAPQVTHEDPEWLDTS